MLIAVVSTPEFSIPIKEADVEPIVAPLIIFVKMFNVSAAAEFSIPLKSPVPELVPAIIEFVEIVSNPLAPILLIPVYADEDVPNAEQFCIVFPVMEITPVAAFRIPVNLQTPVVVVPLVPIVIECAVVVLPIELLAIIKLPAVPAVFIP